jgi:hypothetical protein
MRQEVPTPTTSIPATPIMNMRGYVEGSENHAFRKAGVPAAALLLRRKAFVVAAPAVVWKRRPLTLTLVGGWWGRRGAPFGFVDKQGTPKREECNNSRQVGCVSEEGGFSESFFQIRNTGLHGEREDGSLKGGVDTYRTACWKAAECNMVSNVF